MKKEIAFLKDLQKQMQYEDEHDNDGQISPRYWALMDYKWVTSEDGEHERVSIFFYESCDTVLLEDYVQSIISSESNGEYEEADILELKERHEWDTESEILEWIHEHDRKECYLIYEEEVSFIVPGTLFLTKKEAKNHIESNQHRYTKNVHTFAMTAFRSPQVAKLFEVLRTCNWDEYSI